MQNTAGGEEGLVERMMGELLLGGWDLRGRPRAGGGSGRQVPECGVFPGDQVGTSYLLCKEQVLLDQ